MSYILEYPNIFSSILCEDIIDLFDEYTIQQNTNVMNIPKNVPEWDKIERIIYKNILIKLNEYKISMLNKNDEIVNELSKQLKLNHFTIQKYDLTNIPSNLCRINSRKNVITFIIFLNKPKGGNIIFKKINNTLNNDTLNINNTLNINIKNDNLNEEYVVIPEIGKIIIFPDDINHIFKINSYEDEYYIISNQISYF
jgi:hypothetical protein